MSDWVGTVKQDGMIVAEVTAPTQEQCVRKVAHYAMMYGQDGPVEIGIVELSTTPLMGSGDE